MRQRGALSIGTARLSIMHPRKQDGLGVSESTGLGTGRWMYSKGNARA